MGIFLTYKERYKEDQKVHTIETVTEKEVNILKWWQIALMWIGTAALVIVLGKIIAILIRRKPI